MGTTASEGSAAEQGFSLSSVYPNPVAGDARIALAQPAPQPVRLALYDVLGREVAVLHDGLLPAAADLAVPTAALPNGVYVVRAVGGEHAAARRFVVQH